MTQKLYNLITAILFTIVALVHLDRIARGWDVVVAGHPIPMSVSWFGLIIPGILALYGLMFGLRKFP